VLAELRHPLAPNRVKKWAFNLPAWVEVLSPSQSRTVMQLDPGECEAIALAAEVHADIVLMDDRAARQEAARRGLRVAGTLSILDDADQAGLIDFEQAVAELQRTSFRLSQPVLAKIREKRSH
jgi:predicted nucleic acid-binding protein